MNEINLPDHCGCAKGNNVRSFGGYHIERLSLESAEYLLRGRIYGKFRLKQQREPNDEERRILDREVSQLAPNYAGSDIAIEMCPRYKEAVENNRKALKLAETSKRQKTRLAEDERGAA